MYWDFVKHCPCREAPLVVRSFWHFCHVLMPDEAPVETDVKSHPRRSEHREGLFQNLSGKLSLRARLPGAAQARDLNDAGDYVAARVRIWSGVRMEARLKLAIIEISSCQMLPCRQQCWGDAMLQQKNQKAECGERDSSRLG